MDREESPGDVDRVRAAIATLPFLAIGAFNVVLVLLWGAEYLWGFLVLLPVLFVSALSWFAFRAPR